MTALVATADGEGSADDVALGVLGGVAVVVIDPPSVVLAERVTEPLIDAVGVRDDEGDAPREKELVAVPDTVEDGDGVDTGVTVTLVVGEMDGEEYSERDDVGVPEVVDVSDSVDVPEDVVVPEPVTVGETDGVCEGVGVNEGVPEDVFVCVDDPDFEGVSEGVFVAELEGVDVAVVVVDGVDDNAGLGDVDALAPLLSDDVGEAVVDEDRLGEMVAEGESLFVADPDGVALPVEVCDDESLCVAVGLFVTLGVAVFDGVPVVVGDSVFDDVTESLIVGEFDGDAPEENVGVGDDVCVAVFDVVLDFDAL